jgi:hypothetical protein
MKLSFKLNAIKINAIEIEWRMLCFLVTTKHGQTLTDLF